MTELLRELQEEFMAKGRQQGLQQGRKEGKREVAERMFRKGASVSDVVELTGLSEEEAEEIRKKVN
ncbi:transposase [Alicyclobacillus macrosporangiidus]|nr:transposase [Alicyclobacillus macrosporangiidus]